MKNKLIDSIIDRGNFEKAVQLIPFLYYFMLFIAFFRIEGLNHMITYPQGQLLPRWPLFWANFSDYATVTTIVMLFFVLASLVGSYFYYHFFARFIAFLGMLQFHAYNSSFGMPNHQWDVWLWVSFIFIFLPDVFKTVTSEDLKRKFLLIFWTAQAFLLMTYTLSGIGKMYGFFEQFSRGEAHAFSLDSAALHVSTLLYSMQETTLLGPLIVNNPLLGYIPFLLILYLQLFSVVIAFKPSLHKIWGLGLILFHLSTFLAMRAIFVSPVALILILLFISPFEKKREDWKQLIFDLPIFGLVIRRLFK